MHWLINMEDLEKILSSLKKEISKIYIFKRLMFIFNFPVKTLGFKASYL